ncbi:hypothetical protein D3C87_2139410 [compost metagenome]
MMKVATMPGAMIGTTICSSVRNGPAPSIAAACSISIGIRRRNGISSQKATGTLAKP